MACHPFVTQAYAVCALLVAVLGALGCWQDPTEFDFHSQRLVVEVREAGGAPVADVELVLRAREAAPEQPPVARVRTDAGGLAQFGEQLGALEITVITPEGYQLAPGQGNPVPVGVTPMKLTARLSEAVGSLRSPAATLMKRRTHAGRVPSVLRASSASRDSWRRRHT